MFDVWTAFIVGLLLGGSFGIIFTTACFLARTLIYEARTREREYNRGQEPDKKGALNE
jgi:hypothetical protein